MQCAPHELAACSFPAWYPVFEHLTFRSELLPLPPGFADFLVRDGVFVRSGTSALPRRGIAVAEDGDADGEAYRDWQESEDSPPTSPFNSLSEQDPADEFTGFLAEVDAAIARLGGTVLPKLNWSAPKDAVWLKPSRDIACKTADEVLLLLQSSDRIAHDICNELPACSAASSTGEPATQPAPQPTLVLRQWRALTPGREFRCFVANGELAGVSQRDVTEHFPALPAQTDDLAEALLVFHEERMQGNAFGLPDYAYDVYVTPRGTVRLVDVNPVGGTTSPLLFDWAELPYGHRLHATALNGTDPCRSGEADATSHRNAASEQQKGAAGPAVNGHACGTAGSATEGSAEATCSSEARGWDGARTPDEQRPDADGPAHCSPRAQVPNGVGHMAVADLARGADSDAVLPLDFRIVTEPVNIQPASALYGVPYDLVDQSAGSALAELMRLTE